MRLLAWRVANDVTESFPSSGCMLTLLVADEGSGKGWLCTSSGLAAMALAS
jgi:hypothetical protein